MFEEVSKMQEVFLDLLSMWSQELDMTEWVTVLAEEGAEQPFPDSGLLATDRGSWGAACVPTGRALGDT